jgi:hypothetical protein
VFTDLPAVLMIICVVKVVPTVNTSVGGVMLKEAAWAGDGDKNNGRRTNNQDRQRALISGFFAIDA